MIQANELRIGNWALYPHTIHEPFQITEPRHIELAYLLKPIPLTPEILEACGFHHLHSNTKRGRYYVEAPYIGGELRSEIAWWPITQVISINSTFNAVGEELQYTELYLPHIRHLHQLMNLWHSLTGFELSINLEKVKI